MDTHVAYDARAHRADPPQPTPHSAVGDEARYRFALLLKKARRQAGEPSLRTLVSRSRWHDSHQPLSAGQISRVLNEHADASWPFTTAFLDAVGVAPSEITEVWLPRWIAMRDSLHPLEGPHSDPPEASPWPQDELEREPQPQPQPGPAADATAAGCPECGLHVADPALHHAWHRQWTRIPTKAGQDPLVTIPATSDTGVLRLVPGTDPDTAAPAPAARASGAPGAPPGRMPEAGPDGSAPSPAPVTSRRVVRVRRRHAS